MARRSNKTAHVLNLIAGHEAQKEETEEVVSSGAADAPASADTGQAAPAPSVPSTQNIAVIDTTEKDPVADLIQQKLSDVLEEESPRSAAAGTSVQTETAAPSGAEMPVQAETAAQMAGSTSAQTETATRTEAAAQTEAAARLSADTSAQAEASAQTEAAARPSADTSAQAEAAAQMPGSTSAQTETVTRTEAAAQTETADRPSADTSAQAEASAQTETADRTADGMEAPAASPEPEVEPEPSFAAVNVMERIVHDKIIYYMRQFEVCTCDRCVADTIALTLNGLMPKYIVTMPSAVDPLISYYTNRLISDVTVEATKACMIVKDNPRH